MARCGYLHLCQPRDANQQFQKLYFQSELIDQTEGTVVPPTLGC